MLTLLGQAGVVDDPGLNRTVPLHLGHHHLANLGQHLLVRPLSLTNSESSTGLASCKSAFRSVKTVQYLASGLGIGLTCFRQLAFDEGNHRAALLFGGSDWHQN